MNSTLLVDVLGILDGWMDRRTATTTLPPPSPTSSTAFWILMM